MFRTYREAELPGAAFADSSLQLWAYVEHSLQLPWFYVTLSERQDSVVHCRMLMLSSVYLLKRFLEQQSNNAWVIDIQLVSPERLNKTSRWLMEPLLEVTEIADESDTASGYIYMVEGDRYYIEGTFDQPAPNTKRVIYAAVNQL